MLIRRLDACKEFLAKDASRLRELANAATEPRAFRYSIAEARVGPGEKTLPHRLAASEAYYILEGTGRMHIAAESADVETGCFIDIPPRAEQWIENTGGTDLVFLCIVDPAWRPEHEL